MCRKENCKNCTKWAKAALRLWGNQKREMQIREKNEYTKHKIGRNHTHHSVRLLWLYKRYKAKREIGKCHQRIKGRLRFLENEREKLGGNVPGKYVKITHETILICVRWKWIQKKTKNVKMCTKKAQKISGEKRKPKSKKKIDKSRLVRSKTTLKSRCGSGCLVQIVVLVKWGCARKGLLQVLFTDGSGNRRGLLLVGRGWRDASAGCCSGGGGGCGRLVLLYGTTWNWIMRNWWGIEV